MLDKTRHNVISETFDYDFIIKDIAGDIKPTIDPELRIDRIARNRVRCKKSNSFINNEYEINSFILNRII